MAATNFSGPVVSAGGFTGDITGNITASTLNIPAYAATAIADANANPNIADKIQGSVVFDVTNNLLYIATGSNATDAWVLIDGVGSTTVTPS